MKPELLELDRELNALAKLRSKGGAVALALVLEARREQIEKHGHDETADAGKSPHELAEIGRRYVQEAIEILHPGDRQNLDVGIKRLARGGAMMLAAIERAKKEKGK